MQRGASLLFASLGALIGLVFPYLLARHACALNQSIILVMMFAIAGAFIHGVGFQPRARWLDHAISPLVTWPVLAATAGSLLALR